MVVCHTLHSGVLRPSGIVQTLYVFVVKSEFVYNSLVNRITGVKRVLLLKIPLCDSAKELCCKGRLNGHSDVHK